MAKQKERYAVVCINDERVAETRGASGVSATTVWAESIQGARAIGTHEIQILWGQSTYRFDGVYPY